MASHRIKNHPVNEHVLSYKGARWGVIALVLSIASLAIFLTQDQSTPPNGGTWQGYTLGTVAALLIVWLTALGVRKRSYRAAGTVQGWVSAHVYLGTACLLIGTLHCAFQFGANVHTLAWILMTAVILSGFYGLFAYLRFPSLLSRTRANQTRDELIEQLGDIDNQALELARKIGTDLYSFVDSAVERSAVGGSRFQQLLNRDTSKVLLPAGDGKGGQAVLVSNTDQTAAIDYLARRMSKSPNGDEAARLRQLIRLFATRRGLLRRIRKDIQIQGLLQVWLFVHVPFTVALLLALTIHIVSVFYFW